MRIEIKPCNRINFSTKGFNDIVDITEEVKRCIKCSGVDDGICFIFLPGSTGAVTALEYEGGVISDLLRALDIIAPVDGDYAHNRKWGDGNGYAHVRSAMVKPNFAVPIEEGKPVLGRWQQIVFVDFDNKPRERELIVKIIPCSNAERE
jgi:secondary thiamine-phosphate synthase enzyme